MVCESEGNCSSSGGSHVISHTDFFCSGPVTLEGTKKQNGIFTIWKNIQSSLEDFLSVSKVQVRKREGVCLCTKQLLMIQ